jgi:predicted GIY-YIG superfamily endonuclease
MNDATYLYRLYDEAGQLLYIGISNRAARRWIQHLVTKPWSAEIQRMERGLSFENREDAHQAERLAIMAEAPRYNITHNEYRDLQAPRLTEDERIGYWIPAVLLALADLGEARRTDIFEWFESESERLDRALLRLIDTGHVIVVSGGLWTLTELGRNDIESWSRE